MAKKRTFKLEFKHIDYWGRPIFKLVNEEIYFSSVNILFPDKKIAPNSKPEEIVNFFKKHPDYITYHGPTSDSDPYGGKADNWVYEFVDV